MCSSWHALCVIVDTIPYVCCYLHVSACCLCQLHLAMKYLQLIAGLKKSQVSSMTVSYSISAGTCTDIYSADTSGQHNKLFAVPTLSPLLGLFWYQSAGQLVSVTASGELFVHGSSPADSQQWECMMKLKIGAGNRAVGESKLMVAWITEHILASASGQDDIIHLYDLETENNYILRTGMCTLNTCLACCLCWPWYRLTRRPS